MNALAQCELILNQAELGCAVVATATLDHFELLDPHQMTTQAAMNFTARGLVFIGVVTVQSDGTPKSAFVVPMSEDAVNALAELFAARVTAELEARELERWAALPDTRPDWTVN